MHAIERLVSCELGPKTVRCRLFHDGIAIQLDPASLARVRPELRAAIGEILRAHGEARVPRFEPYRMGSALRKPATNA